MSLDCLLKGKAPTWKPIADSYRIF